MKRLLPLLLLPLLVSCAGRFTIKGFGGIEPPREELALVESGPWTKIERCDDLTLGNRHFNVLLFPGEHTIEVSFLQREVGNVIFYSNARATLTFQAEKGKRYKAYAEIVHSSEWVLKITETGSGREVAKSAPLPLKVEMILFGGDGSQDIRAGHGIGP